MINIQRDDTKSGFTACVSDELSKRFTELSREHGLSLEETVSRVLVPLICSAILAPARESAPLEALVEQKMREYVDYPTPLLRFDRPTPPRGSSEKTTFTWALAKRSKAEMSVLADLDSRKLGNWLSWRMIAYSRALFQRRAVTLTDAEVESTLGGGGGTRR